MKTVLRMRRPTRPAGTATSDPITGWVPGTHMIGNSDTKIPDDHRYYITTFGGGADRQCVACSPSGIAAGDIPRATQADVDNQATTFCTSTRSPLADGTWWYIADRQRFGCGTRVRITDPVSGRSAVAVAADTGPHYSVERDAQGPVIDASPLVLQHLFGHGSYGWSDRVVVIAEPVDPSTPLGPSGVQQLNQPAVGPTAIVAVTLIAMAVGAAWWLNRNVR